MINNIPILLDGRPVEKITAYLFQKGGSDDPKTLLANAGKSFIGSYILGMGFTFDDSNPDATSIAEMHRLIAENPKNTEVIFPYIGGEEVNSSPTHEHNRYVINFGERSEDEARKYPNIISIIEEKVKPKRLKDNRTSYRNYWWHYAEKRVELMRSLIQYTKVLVIARHTEHCSFIFYQSSVVFAESLVVIPLDNFSAFTNVSSKIHETWARFFGSSLGSTLRYSPSDCFETFPFPLNWETDRNLEEIGKTYYEYRAELMVKNNQGLTDTYNRFHDPNETDPEILQLRDLHAQMDQAVLNAYGWTDLELICGFALDYLDTDEDNLPPEAQERIQSGDLFFPTADEAITFDNLVRTGKRKLPWRYKWPEKLHDDILASLLDLNQKRYDEEWLAGKHADKKTKTRKKSEPNTPPRNLTLK